MAAATLRGDVTAFLGAGSNFGGPVGDSGDGPVRLPTAQELSERLHGFARARDVEPTDLLRVAQYVAVFQGWAPLYRELRDVFGSEYEPSAPHRFLARLPALLRSRGTRQQLIVTTNYDDALECAFSLEGEDLHVVSYIANPKDPDRGMFRHRMPDDREQVVRQANTHELPLDDCPALLKIHGAIDREDPAMDSFVIAEDHYIDYMARTQLSRVLPITLLERLQESSILFMGYGLKDWNLRVFLRRLWGDTEPMYARWAVQRAPAELDLKYWQRHGVEVIDGDLKDYVETLEARLALLAAETG